VPFADAFESDLASWDSQNAVLVPQSGSDGGQSAQIASNGTSETDGVPSYLQRSLGTGEQSLYIALDVKPAMVADGGVRLVTVTNLNGDVIVSLYLAADGGLAIRWAESETVAPAGQIDPTLWNRIELHVSVDGSTSNASVWINDVSAGSEETVNPSLEIGRLILGSWGTNRTFDLLLDNVRVDRTCGATCPDPVATEPTEAAPVDEIPPATGSPTA
jgi:hypothetical protein